MLKMKKKKKESRTSETTWKIDINQFQLFSSLSSDFIDEIGKLKNPKEKTRNYLINKSKLSSYIFHRLWDYLSQFV